MKVIPYKDENWLNYSPKGVIECQHFLLGEPDSIDNFMLFFARHTEEFVMPRHRHNFEQLRFALVGNMILGDNLVLGEREIGYFPEGTPYGPQNDPAGEHLQLVLQFGGASGYGYLGVAEWRAGWLELSKTGKFDGPYYHYADGRTQWGLNAIWEHLFDTKLKYPKPRYTKPVIVSPKSFNWLPMRAAPGVARKFLGAFSERAVWIEMLKVAKDATWVSSDAEARRIFMVLSGSGTAGSAALGEYTAIQAEAGETLQITAESDMVLYCIGLPPIVLPETASEAFELEDLPPQPVAV